MQRARIGAVGYLNARPLCEDLDESQFDVFRGVPADVAARLADGQLDVALVPVAAILAGGDYRVVPGFCIGCDGPVESVLLVAERPPEQWTRVVLDADSRTSQLLATLLLTEGPLSTRVPAGLVIEVCTEGRSVDAARGDTAALVIGDPARQLPERLTEVLDCGGLWKEWTGLPFVFAVWAGRPDLPRAVQDHVRQAGQLGLEARARRYPDPADQRYLLEKLRYTLDDHALIGLRRFAALGARRGWFASGDVVLYGPPVERLSRPAELDALLLRGATGGRLAVAEALVLAEHARLADLLAAADVRARGEREEAVARWALAVSLDVSDLPAAVARAQAAVADGATRATLHKLPIKAGLAAVCDAIRALHTGAPTLALRGLSRDDVARLGAPPAVALKALAEAGLAGLDLDDRGPLLTAEDASGREVLGAALAQGLAAEASLWFGRGEGWPQRLQHLDVLRALHDHHGGLRTVTVRAAGWRGEGSEGEGTAAELLRVLAVARLFLDRVDAIAVSWVAEGLGVLQAALHGGADALEPMPWAEGWAERAGELDRIVRDAGFDVERVGMATPAPKAGGHVQRRRVYQPLRADLRA